MKATLFDSNGKQKSQIELPAVFNTPVREDLIKKAYEAEKFSLMQSYGPDPRAGRKHSASGTIRHARHKWKGHYGKGISRLPRKQMWRRGTQFLWVGAEVSNTRGGRSVHAASRVKAFRKINQKERTRALQIGIAATAQPTFLAQHYPTLTKITSPVILESLPKKVRACKAALQTILGDAMQNVFQVHAVRHGKGKLRGRKYKSSAGALVVVGSKESQTLAGLEVVSAKELMMHHVYPLGRIAVYTQAALEELK
ncbi:50S ribosomal protein L4 [Candidatus Pacearchaeota archaeon]|nr:50S ribosomal protein L4 [Candidatus Pacearchaeota archaeon]